MKIIVEESALDSIKLMATRLQNERDMLLQVLDNVLLRWEGTPQEQTPREVKDAQQVAKECKEVGKLWA
jgi:hypothetical protein